MFYTAPRFTKDLDLWVKPTRENAEAILQALGKFGAPLADLTVNDLTVPGTIFQIGMEPNRVDLITQVDGLDFENAWKNKKKTTYEGVPIYILGIDDLMKNKSVMGRVQDQIDLQNLVKAKKTFSKK